MRALFGGKELDVAPDELPAFTYEVDGIDAVASIRGSRSTTMKLPPSQRNREALGGWSVDEDAKRQDEFSVVTGTAELFGGRGFVRSRGAEGYELFAVGDNARWISALKDRRLRDAGFGISKKIYVANAGDPPNELRISDTWVDETNPLYFPLVDYGGLEFRSYTFEVPFSWVPPGIRVALFMQRIFANAGFGIYARGGFASVWPKLVMPNTNDKVLAGDTVANSARFSKTVAQTYATLSAPAQVNFDTVISDPSNGYNNNGRFTPDLSMALAVRLSELNISAAFSGSSATVLFSVYDHTANAYVSTVTIPLGGGASGFDGEIEIPPFQAVGGRTYSVRAQITTPSPLNYGTLTITAAVVDYLCQEISYADGNPVDIDSCAPDMGALECLKGICTTFNVVPVTKGRTVELWYYDEIRGKGEGFDLRGRMTAPHARISDERPEAFLFVHERDDKDREIAQLRDIGGPYAAGDYRMEMGGEDSPQEVRVPFPATQMGVVLQDAAGVLQGLRIPLLRDRDGQLQSGFYPQKYGWKARLLIADGVAPATWYVATTTQGVIEYNTYPVCYSYNSSNDPTTLMGPLGASQGNAVKFWRTRAMHLTSDKVLAEIVWHDHEVMQHDLSRHVRMDLDAGSRLWIVEKIEQHRFGLGRPSRTTLIPL